MKRILILVMLSICGLLACAEKMYFTAYEAAYKFKNDYNRNSQIGWSDWRSCNILIEFDLNMDMIVIYSESPQIYAIYESVGSYNDSGGGKQIGFNVIDQDYDKGMIRLRTDSDGTAQLYVDFNDVGWVYNVRRK